MEPTAANPSPEYRLNVFIRWTYGWISPLLKNGYKHPLQQKELWDLDAHLQAKNINATFDAAWQKELQRPNVKSSPSIRLLRVLFAAFGKDLVRSAGDMGVTSILSVGSSVLLLYMITWIQDTQAGVATFGDWFGYVMAISIFLAQLFTTFADNWQLELTTKTGYNIKTSLIAALYKKSLVLSGKSRLKYSIGMITNIIATDTNRVDIACQYLNMGWGAPFQITMATALLIWTIGPSALVGLAVMLLYIPAQSKITSMLTSSRRKANVDADRRIKLIQETLLGIRVIKIYSWEESFEKVLSDIRTIELKHIYGFLLSRAIIAGITQAVPTFSMIASFVCFSLLGNELNPAKVFASLSLFYSFRFALMFTPLVISQVTDAWIAIGRIGALLLADELDNAPKMLPLSPESAEPAIDIDDATFEWDQAEVSKEDSVNSPTRSFEKTFKLDKLNIKIPQGKLIAVVGTVGSGKSSFLNALVGEMRKVSGDVTFRGTVGYCQQHAWIQNATVKENILFGMPYNAAKYKSVIHSCALESDFAILSSGDSTEIGERGINLSGGQKQRISIARAVYFDPDIVLFDDPLSAVDSHVGRFLFEECILKTLDGKTRVLVTHQLHFLPRVDYILMMDHGRIVAQGTFDELFKTNLAFSALMQEYGGLDDKLDEEVEKPKLAENSIKNAVVRKNSDTLAKSESIKKSINEPPPDGHLMTVEERNTGLVDTRFYMSYLKMAGGMTAAFTILIVLILSQVLRVMTDQWLAYWSSNRFHLHRDTYIGTYVGLGAVQVITSVSYGAIVSYFGAIASKQIHEHALSGVFRSPISFFDSTPLGRITSRFSRDVDGVDSTLPDSIRVVVQCLTMTLSNFVLISVVFPYFLIPLAPILVGFYLLQAYYRSTARELKRLDSVSRSPLIANVSETLTGLATIRAYNSTSRFVNKTYTLIDDCNRNYYPSIMIQRWIQLRLESLNAILVLMAAIFAVIQKSHIGAGVAGLVVAYAIQVTSVLNWSVKRATETELSMNSAERLIHYAEELTPEAPDVVTKDTPGAILDLPASWPQTGHINIDQVVLRYRKDLPPVLHGVSFVVHPGQKVGIVGRTGAGKSSIMSSILRLFEIESGSVIIDGVDVKHIGLRDLRRRIGVIPQEPVLFSGTVRSNLDPFSQYQDSELWSALERANLKPTVAEASGGLDSVVTENGDNWSTGQRQLICLARAMLKNAKIIMLDEATASVDMATDDFIQKAIRKDFASTTTVLTIAHRLNTIADYDMILVLGSGRVIEFDSPRNLLANPNSHFFGMVAETGPVNADLIHSLANGKSLNSVVA
ncbi:hypothetical protein BATDEDRAFT_19380 [Batrachochytrium dendrobatidis JAM81]|uniref:Uncharacterized protein n=2 Tax=Batrachochytrium dendrobatidis TaxID=109871 RepID=F4P102_BATDJ|nr:uncharacterized protein BATDEDRAFT_19380 [Batrachochytrium dendrobatidis JAM81]EGF81682.1 hypothetical protein BATDEDRAFT_19380 [Batrachochytrium dendrobatidis JAM81]OAJ37942.1 hypothetical protein BDEG_21913 [Batrachochytrium dendrobatidis JEL423]|eukprot:XP_006677821.1 hypothetical protein BATDEDRAFT_19380 [Batrachochytrium dendrobatidis JAM81]